MIASKEPKLKIDYRHKKEMIDLVGAMGKPVVKKFHDPIRDTYSYDIVAIKLKNCEITW